MARGDELYLAQALEAMGVDVAVGCRLKPPPLEVCPRPRGPVQLGRCFGSSFSVFAEEVRRVNDVVRVVAAGALRYDRRGEIDSDISGVVED